MARDLKKRLVELLSAEKEVMSDFLDSTGYIWCQENYSKGELWISDGFWNSLGYDVAAIPVATWDDIIHKDDLEHFRQAYTSLEEGIIRVRVKNQRGGLEFFQVEFRSAGPDRDLITGKLIPLNNIYTRFLTSVETLRDAIFVIGRDTKLLEVYTDRNNDLHAQREGFLGKSIDQLDLPREVKRKIEHAFNLATTEKKESVFSFSLPLNGNRNFFEARTNAISDSQGQVYEVLFAIKNVTYKVTQQRILAEKKKELEFFFDSSLYGAFFMMLDEPVIWNEEIDKAKALEYVFQHQRVTRVNKEILKQYGAEEKDFIGFRPLDFFPHDYQQAVYVWKKLFDKGRVSQETVERDAAGNEVIFEGDYVCLYDENGAITGHFGVQRDVTGMRKAEAELKESEEKFRSLIENLQTGVVVHGPDTQILLYNSRALTLLGLDGDQLMGKTSFDPRWNVIKENGEVFPGEEHPSVVAAKTRKKVAEVIMGVFNPRRKGRVWLQVDANPQVSSSEEVSQIVVTFTDVTEKIKTQENLARAVEQADEANLAKSEFLANMTHELRTPLNGIVGFSDLLLEKNLLDEEARMYTDLIHKSAHSLKDIISDILDFSKIEASKIDLNLQAFSLHSLVDEIFKTFDHQIDQDKLTFLLSVKPEVPDLVTGDELRIKQVLNNLLSNAIKFTEKGCVELSVSAVDVSESSGRLMFSVKDTGIGIPRENHLKIYEAFTQGDASTTKIYGGTGLGLTISNQLLKMMGSKMEVESEEGKGSRFFFELELPLASVDNSPKGLSEKSEQDFGALDILVIDDNKINLILTETILKDLVSDGSVDSVTNGMDGLELYKSKKYDFVFLDLQMPQMNGYQTFEEMQRQVPHSQAKVIALTAANVKGESDKCLQMGMSGFISKPVTREDFITYFSEQINRVALELNFDRKAFDRSFSPETLDVIREETLKYLKEVEEDLKDEKVTADKAALAAVAHKLKGTSLNLKFNRLANLAKLYEKAILNGGDDMRQVKDSILREIEVLTRVLGSAKS